LFSCKPSQSAQRNLKEEEEEEEEEESANDAVKCPIDLRVPVFDVIIMSSI